MSHHNNRGYILVLVLIIMSFTTILVTQLVWKGMTFVYFSKTMMDREKAKMLALSGLQLAQHQLDLSETATTKEDARNKKEKQDSPEAQMHDWMVRVVPTLNREQEIILKKNLDGIDGTIRFVITCEQGKIDPNQIYDFEKKKFIGEGETNDWKKVMQDIFARLKGFVKNKDLFGVFEKFLKERQHKIYEITELLEIPEFKQAFESHIFYKPPSTETKDKKRPLYLTDIFTIWSGTATMQPLFLSDSLLAILDLQRAQHDDIEKRTQHIKSIFDPKTGQMPIGSTQQTWDKMLKPLYGKDFQTIPKNIQQILQMRDVTQFSVIVSAQVDRITQKIFAIIEKRVSENSDTDKEKFVINRFYWL